MTAFDQAWNLIKEDQKIGYDVNIQPETDLDMEILAQFEGHLADMGITYDSGWGSKGRDIHLDFSLKGAQPDDILEILSHTGLKYSITMIAYEPKQEYIPDYSHLPDPVEMTDPASGQAAIVGPPVTCPSCGDPQAAFIREPIDEGGHLTFNCGQCGYGPVDPSDAFPGGEYDEFSGFDQRRR